MKALVVAAGILVLGQLAAAGELQTAAAAGDAAKVQALLKDGADVNATGDHGRTALHEAAAHGKLDVLRLLMGAGANPQTLDGQQHTPGYYAVTFPDPALRAPMVEVLREMTPVMTLRETDPWTLHNAASHGQINVVQMLIKMGANVNALGAGGNRPLAIACLKGNAAIVQALVEAGADVNLRSPGGSTPLHDAALSGNVAVGEILLAHGAMIDAVEKEAGATPLYYAVSFGRSDFAKLLIEKGAAVQVKTASGKTPLAAAAEMGLKDVEALLRSRGAKQ